VLDEATSALDGEAEERVQDAIEHMKGSTTMVIVAHRLKTIRIADRIAVLHNGELAEVGSWDELMARGGLFHQMAKTQGLA
jgi:ABC-type multidrug transport system fused ATPase/permease subunit